MGQWTADTRGQVPLNVTLKSREVSPYVPWHPHCLSSRVEGGQSHAKEEIACKEFKEEIPFEEIPFVDVRGVVPLDRPDPRGRRVRGQQGCHPDGAASPTIRPGTGPGSWGTGSAGRVQCCRGRRGGDRRHSRPQGEGHVGKA